MNLRVLFYKFYLIFYGNDGDIIIGFEGFCWFLVDCFFFM